MDEQTLIPITPDLLDGTKNARGKEVVLSTGQVLQRIQFADFVKELGLEENSFEFKAITPASPAPTKTGLYFPMSAGVYPNFGNITITEGQFDSSFIFIVFDGVGFQLLIKPIDFIPVGKVNKDEINAVSGKEVYNYVDSKIRKTNISNATIDNIIEKSFVANGGEIKANSAFKILEYKLPIDTKQVHLKMNANGQGINAVHYFNSAGNWIGQEIPLNTTGSGVVIDQNLNIPNDTDKIYLNTISGDSSQALTVYVMGGYYDFDLIENNNLAIREVKETPLISTSEDPGTFINNSGVKVNNQYYKTTNFRLEKGVRYVLSTELIGGSNIYLIHYYDDLNNWIGSEYFKDTTGQGTTKFSNLKLSVHDKNVNAVVNSGAGSSVSVSKLEFGEYYDFSEMKKEIDDINKSNSLNKRNKVVIGDTELYVRTKLNSEVDIIIKYFFNVDNNNFTPADTYLGSNLLSDSEIMTKLVHNTWDSTGPVWMPEYWYLFAQHGYLVPTLVAEHNLTNNDIGSKWKDDLNREYEIGRIQGNTITLLPKITKGEIEGKDTRSWKTHAQNNYTKLIHVSGGTSIADIIPISKTAIQIRPIENVISRTFLADGVEVDKGTYFCDELIISETLRGVNPVFVEKWFPSIESVDSMAEITQSFIISGLSCSVNSILNTLYPLDFTYYGANQARTLSKVGDFDSYAIIPKIKPREIWGETIDFSKPFKDSDTTRTDLYINKTESHLIDINEMPDRIISFQKNNLDNYQLGFASGMSLTRGLTKKGVWASNIGDDKNTLAFSPANQNKFYTRVLEKSKFENSLLPVGYVAEVNYYFAYFMPKEDEQSFVYKDGNKWLIYISVQKSGNISIDTDMFLEGKYFKVFEKTNDIDIVTRTVQNGKIIINSKNNNGNYIVLIED